MRKDQELSVNWESIFKDSPQMEGESQRGWFRRLALLNDCQYEKIKSSYYRHANKFRDLEQYKTESIRTDKKEANFSWRDPIRHLKGLQEVFKQGKDSQDFSSWSIDADNIRISGNRCTRSCCNRITKPN